MTQPETLTRVVTIDPATRFVRSLPGNYSMLREAAHACGVSQFTLRKFIADDVEECTPSKYTMFGKVKIYLYTDEDIASIKKYLKSQVQIFDHNGQARRIGRPPKYAEDERHDRDKLHSKKWYWNNRVKLLTERGDIAGAKEAKKRVKEIDEELKRK